MECPRFWRGPEISRKATIFYMVHLFMVSLSNQRWTLQISLTNNFLEISLNGIITSRIEGKSLKSQIPELG
jgi:hypothetical protein